ncbi:hypothetical protein FG93_03035 [Bosea sp. LC85]|nr:hypothetical protein FG93_03035 [Bosea sp. LC85]
MTISSFHLAAKPFAPGWTKPALPHAAGLPDLPVTELIVC